MGPCCTLCCQTLPSLILALVYHSLTSELRDKETVCATDGSIFTPFAYQTPQQLNAFLAHPGSINVSDRFLGVTRFGQVLNWVFLGYGVCSMCVISAEGKMKLGRTSAFSSFLLHCASLTQFLLLLCARFSHSGRVCSGDFREYILGVGGRREDGRGRYDDRFDKYFLDSAGNFFYYYSIFCLSAVLVGLCCLVALGYSVGVRMRK